MAKVFLNPPLRPKDGRTLRNRFSQGGVVQTVIFGYVKPHGAKSDEELQKDPAVEPIHKKRFDILEDGGAFSEVADWLNRDGVPTGPYLHVIGKFR
jgi:hypothetical protein